MTDEQFVRLNIFSLCESIARTKWEDTSHPADPTPPK
jgi:hypothetical protein